MRLLTTEGSGLTSRQVAARLAALGHEVGLVTSDPLCLSRFTRTVRRVHRVPAYGQDPFGWLDATLEVVRTHDYDVLFPTQEQVAVLSRCQVELSRAGVRTIVPRFDALAAVQDKLSAHATLARLGVPQPRSAVVTTASELSAWDEFPVFVKLPIGTATSGVRRVADRDDLAALIAEWAHDGGFDGGGVLVQTPVPGPLVMVQSVFRHGELMAFHANERTREGARGGASHKRSTHLDVTRAHLARLGGALDWHGALSLDVMLGPDCPLVIDVNPRLVEPMNAWHSGTDLVAAMVALAADADAGDVPATGAHAPADREGVRTHQLLLAVLGAAERGAGRRGVLRELVGSALHRGDYRDSSEELTPWRRDLRALVPVVAASLVTLVRPAAWHRVSSGSVASYAMGPDSWRRILDGRTPSSVGAPTFPSSGARVAGS